MLGWPRFWAGQGPSAMVEFWLTVAVFVIALAVIFVWWVLELA